MHTPRLSKTTGSGARAARALPVLGACLALAACGSSASTSSSTSTTSTSTSASTKSPQASGSSRFSSLRSCLTKQGITLPAPSGTRPPAGTGAPGQAGPRGGAGGLKLPAGVSRTQFQEALEKCGGGSFGGRGRFNSAAARAAFTRYVACMRENGVSLPTPNTSGNGPVFSTKGINTSSSAFKTATAKCQSDLPGGVRKGNGASSAG